MKIRIDKSGWDRVKLDDVIYWYQKNIPNDQQASEGIENYVVANHIDSDSVLFKRYGLISDGQKGPTITKHFEKGDFLISTRSVALRKAALATVSGVTGEKLLVLRVKEGFELVPGLLPFICHSNDFWEYAQNSASGSVNKFTSWTKLRNYEFLLPPRDQQVQLVELLWSIDKVIDKELKVLEKLKLSREIAFMHHIEQSEGKEVKLSKVLILKKGKSPVPHKREKYIGLEHIQSGAFTCNDYAVSSTVQAQCNIVDAGDLCYSKLRPYLDKAFISVFDAVSTTELLVYDVKDVSKEYVLYHLHSKAFINYASDKGFGTKMPRVDHKIIGEFSIKKLINDRILLESMHRFRDSEEKLANKIEYSKSLQKSLINQIF